MIFALLHCLITLLLDVFATVGIAADEKDGQMIVVKKTAPPSQIAVVITPNHRRNPITFSR